MIFTEEYKKQCFQAFQFDHEKISELMELLEINHVSGVRDLIQESIQELKEEIIDYIEPGEESMHNAKIDVLRQREECDNQLMRMIEQEMEEDGVRQRTRVQES